MSDNRWLQEGWQDVSAILAVVGIISASIWQLVRGKLEHEKNRAAAKLKQAQEQREREDQAFEHMQALLKPYREELELIRKGRATLEQRIEMLESRVADLEKENRTLVDGIMRLCDQIRRLGHVPAFCYEPLLPREP